MTDYIATADIYHGPLDSDVLSAVETVFDGLDAEDISLANIARLVTAVVKAHDPVTVESERSRIRRVISTRIERLGPVTRSTTDEGCRIGLTVALNDIDDIRAETGDPLGADDNDDETSGDTE